MRGSDVWHGSGNVVTDILFSETRGGDPACSFRMAIDKAHKSTVYVRINVYGGNVHVIKKRGLDRGDYCIIGGELMNRRGQGETLTEIRCLEIVIPSSTSAEKRRQDNE